MTPLTTQDFPAAAHDRLDALIVASSAKNQMYSDYAFAHNSIRWRFRGVADSDDDFRKAYQLPTEGDCTEKTYLQERALFEFFAALCLASKCSAIAHTRSGRCLILQLFRLLPKMTVATLPQN
jgi:hypothetical protein